MPHGEKLQNVFSFYAPTEYNFKDTYRTYKDG